MTKPPTRPRPSSRVQELFDAALELPAAERDAFLAAQCGGDPELQREVAELIAASENAPPFLERPAAEVELEGRSAGPWRIETLLSSGGMGDVYRAERADAELPWRVALKVLKRGLDGEAFVRRFHAERRTLAALAHPNIVALIDAGTLEDGRPFLAMELVDGAPIDRHCAERGLDLPACVRLFLDVCAAVEHAHQRFVVHCDLKPGNVLVTAAGVPKLLDFGIARLIAPEAGDAGETRADARPPWTAGYASPELMASGAVGCASDVFSLGVLLRELCTGRRAAGLRVDDDLLAIVRKAAATAPEHRYPSVEQLAADLRAWLGVRPVTARAGGTLDRARKFVRRNRVASIASAIAFVALTYGAIVTFENLRHFRGEASLGWGAHAQALRVSRFLEQIVLDASVDGQGSSAPGLAAALDRAAARLEAGPTLGAESEGRIRMALGTLYLEVDRRDDARRQLERALTLAQSSRGFGGVDIDWIRSLLARCVGH